MSRNHDPIVCLPRIARKLFAALTSQALWAAIPDSVSQAISAESRHVSVNLRITAETWTFHHWRADSPGDGFYVRRPQLRRCNHESSIHMEQESMRIHSVSFWQMASQIRSGLT